MEFRCERYERCVILFIYELLFERFGIALPAAFVFFSTRMVLAALTTLLMVIYLGPRFITKLYELKMGQIIKVEHCPLLAELHKNKKNTPTMGGILILFSVAVAAFLWMDWHSSFSLLLFTTIVFLGVVGGYDDYLKLKYKHNRGMRGRVKLLLQCLFALVFALYLFVPAFSELIHVGDWFAPPVAKDWTADKTKIFLSLEEISSRYYLPFFSKPVLILSGVGALLGILFSVFVVVGASNAVNLTDGLDGLASGCMVMVSLVLALVAFLSNHVVFARYLGMPYIEGSGEIAVFLCALAGANLGFLWYNGHPAQVFMGDTGSLAMGGVIGVSAILLRKEVFLAVVGGIFVAEAMSVILQVLSCKLRGGRRIFLCSPLHHHFEYKGWPETKVVLRFWIVSLLLAMLGLISLKI